MSEAKVPPSLFAEAKARNTPANRLQELAHIEELHPLLAANPATPSNTLYHLSTSSNPAVRSAVAGNPNASPITLCNLAEEFPVEFLQNPLLPLMEITRPDFTNQLPYKAWESLLRLANLDRVWPYNIYYYRSIQATVWKSIMSHMYLVHAYSQVKATTVGQVRRAYQEKLPQPTTLPPEEEADLFLLFVMLFPYTAPMLKTQWVATAQAVPEKVAMALPLLRNMNPRTLARLSQEKDPAVLNQIARHPATPLKVVKHLANYKQQKLVSTSARKMMLKATASDPHTSLETIHQFVSAGDAGLRQKALAHPSLESDDLEIMALDPAISVHAALASSQRLTEELFAQLAGDEASVVRAALARNLKVPSAILHTLAQDPVETVRAAAAGNPRLPVEAQTALLADSAVQVRASLSGNARLRADYAERLAHDPEPVVRAALAANPRTPVSLLSTLLYSKEPEVQVGLARHPKIPPEFLTQLARQGDKRTHVAVAAHTRTPPETLADLASEDSHEIWRALTSNPNTPLNVLELALPTSSVELLHRLIQHPAMRHTKCQPLVKLLISRIQPLIAGECLPNWLRRAFLQYYTALPMDLVACFAASPHWQERYIVANRSHLPEAVLVILAQDDISHVQKTACKTLEQRRTMQPQQNH